MYNSDIKRVLEIIQIINYLHENLTVFGKIKHPKRSIYDFKLVRCLNDSERFSLTGKNDRYIVIECANSGNSLPVAITDLDFSISDLVKGMSNE